MSEVHHRGKVSWHLLMQTQPREVLLLIQRKKELRPLGDLAELQTALNKEEELDWTTTLPCSPCADHEGSSLHSVD